MAVSSYFIPVRWLIRYYINAASNTYNSALALIGNKYNLFIGNSYYYCQTPRLQSLEVQSPDFKAQY